MRVWMQNGHTQAKLTYQNSIIQKLLNKRKTNMREESNRLWTYKVNKNFLAFTE
jgi:hypothetical protein